MRPKLYRITFLWIGGLVAAGALLPALASEAHAEGGAVNPFSGDVGNALWTVVIFGLVLFVLGKYAWGPILSGLQQREAFIREALEKADRDRKDAEARLQEYVDKVNAARAEASAIVEEGKRDADALKHRIEEGAKSEAAAIIARGKREIEIASETAVKDLYSKSAALATQLAGGILGREIKAEDHDKLIAETIARLDAAPRSAAN